MSNLFRRRRYRQLGVVSSDALDAVTVSHPKPPVSLFDQRTAADRLRARATPTSSEPDGD